MDIVLETATRFLDRATRGKWQGIAGTRTIGEGAYRRAYLQTSTGLVYKVGDSANCENEVDTYTDLVNKLGGHSYRMPLTGHTLMIPVTAGIISSDDYAVNTQQYVKGRPTYCPDYGGDGRYGKCKCDGRCWNSIHNDVYNELGISDCHGYNLLVDKDNVLWLVDMGEG